MTFTLGQRVVAQRTTVKTFPDPLSRECVVTVRDIVGVIQRRQLVDIDTGKVLGHLPERTQLGDYWVEEGDGRRFLLHESQLEATL